MTPLTSDKDDHAWQQSGGGGGCNVDRRNNETHWWRNDSGRKYRFSDVATSEDSLKMSFFLQLLHTWLKPYDHQENLSNSRHGMFFIVWIYWRTRDGWSICVQGARCKRNHVVQDKFSVQVSLVSLDQRQVRGQVEIQSTYEWIANEFIAMRSPLFKSPSSRRDCQRWRNWSASWASSCPAVDSIRRVKIISLGLIQNY